MSFDPEEIGVGKVIRAENDGEGGLRFKAGQTDITDDMKSQMTAGMAQLDPETHKVKTEQLPSYVDDVVEGYFYNGQFFEDEQHTILMIAEKGKIYVDLSTAEGKTYRWSGSMFVPIGGGGLPDPSSLAFGTALVAVDGEWTKQEGYGVNDQLFYLGGNSASIVEDEPGHIRKNDVHIHMPEYYEQFTLHVQARSTFLPGASFVDSDFTFPGGVFPYQDRSSTVDGVTVTIGGDGSYIDIVGIPVPQGAFITDWYVDGFSKEQGIYVNNYYPFDRNLLPDSVTSINEKTGDVELTPADIGASTKVMVVTYDDDTTETFNVLIQSE